MIIEEVTRIEVNCEPQEIDVLSKCIVLLDDLLEKMSNQKFEWVFCENKLEWLEFLQEFF